jgi:hypothetical protein
MPEDALERVLRLVAEGKLTADEAGPILDALDERAAAPTTTDDPPRPQSPPLLPVADPVGPSASRSARPATRS